MTSDMELVVGVDGVARCIYDEALDLREIGQLQITRASHVEPDRDGYWWADMGPSGGPVLGPYGSRTKALEAERGWLAIAALLPKPTRDIQPEIPHEAPTTSKCFTVCESGNRQRQQQVDRRPHGHGADIHNEHK